MNDVDSKVSIYMPTHNRANLVVRAVESVLKQSYKNIELIVVDDGSSDNSYELLSKIKDNRLIILRNDKPKGACYSRNRAIEQATGKYITGLDDDDYFNENRIEILLRAFDENYSFVCDNSISFNNGKFNYEDKINREIYLCDILNENMGNQVLTLTSRFKDVGAFDISLPSSQDYDLWTRLIIKYGKALQIPEHTYVYDISHDGKRISTSIRAIEGAKLYFDKYKMHMNTCHIASQYIRFTKYGHLINREQAYCIFKEYGLNQLIRCYLRYVYLRKH